ncbi:WXG100 family type VII secretion target [Nocardia sp. AG03]|uniref:WXG100 family type VII secretion target n=1 Tax=Nocardia sp. AG03 TaxID=3025312 RepID=UPI002418B63D|nr:WXG100 family type VII secretion target [Nocardia sp. AG03]
MTHADIYAAFQATRTADARGLAAGYRQLGNDWATGLHVFSTSIQRSVASSWEGQAADAFVASIKRYTTDAIEFETQLRVLATRIDESAASVETTKYELPEPVEEKNPLHPDSWPIVGSNRDPVIEREQEEAQAIMANKYVTPFVNDYDTQIPVLSSPVNPVQPFDIDEPTAGDRVPPGGTYPGGTNPDGDSPSQHPADDPANDDETTGEDEDPDTTDTPDDESGVDSESSDDDTNPSGTDPDDMDSSPESLTTPAGTTPTGTHGGPGSAGSPSAGLPSGGSPGGSGGGTPEAGRAVPGTPGAGSPVVAATTATAASGASRGTSMGGMPMGGARGGQRAEDEASRGTPDFLINQANTDDLIGDDLPTVTGGVIGAHLVPRNRI